MSHHHNQFYTDEQRNRAAALIQAAYKRKGYKSHVDAYEAIGVTKVTFNGLFNAGALEGISYHSVIKVLNGLDVPVEEYNRAVGLSN